MSNRIKIKNRTPYENHIMKPIAKKNKAKIQKTIQANKKIKRNNLIRKLGLPIGNES